MEERKLIKIQEVIKRCAISRSTLYRLLSDKRFPVPVLLSKRAIAFYEHEIDTWISERTRTR
ncbi:transcriptional regulator [Yersinia similis]|uniref:Transcriptional regulator n=1 Tax=Yersinia similis TaxID=367190 RepID=A0ABN4CR83_9GAMM|nr:MULTISPECIES: AlpA family phage regulatory protein [Yersiniaceae]AHK21119.1 transcriptional regulator [Yersinia similis]MBC3227481.1 AlpA family phage regulatory protein [Serratia fonticola]CFQ59248.1 Regulatory protein [Yersinia similis]